MNTYTLKISNIKCSGCVAAVELAIKSFDDTEIVLFDLQDHIMVIKTQRSIDDIMRAITNTGYPAALQE